MNRSRSAGHLCVLISVILMCASTRAPAAALPMPTMNDLQQMYDAGQYHTCLQQIARVLPGSDRPNSGFDRLQLMLLRGECLMRLGARAAAYRAFVAAQASPEAKTALTARANVVLLEASNQFSYKPPGGGQAIDIQDPVSRRKAMAALFDANLQRNRPQIDTAAQAPSLGPIIDVLPKLKDLAALEVTATGGDKEIRPALSAIGRRARDLIEGALQQVDAQVAQVQQRANQPVMTPATPGSAWWVTAGRQGLDTNDRRQLQDAINSADSIYNATVQGRVTAEALGGKVDLWTALVDRARDVGTHARGVLNAE